MLGVAAEHTFELLLENINSNPKIAKDYSSIANERTILAKITKFTNIIKTQLKLLPNNISEELETNFNGILYLGDRLKDLLIPIPKARKHIKRISEMVKRSLDASIEARELAKKARKEIFTK